MGAGTWFIFMLFVMISVKLYAEGANKVASKMSSYDEAHFKYKRVNRALALAAVVGIVAIPVCIYFSS